MKEEGGIDSPSDEAGVVSTLQDLLADLNAPAERISSRNNATRIAAGQNASSGPWLTSARSSPARQNSLSRPYSYLSRRRSSNPRVVSISSYDQPAASSMSLGPSSSNSSSAFPNPNRSIFTSGQPTSSISVNTAHASMSTPPPARESRPLAAFSGTAIISRRPTPQALQAPLSLTRQRVIAPAEKDADDPTVAMDEPGGTHRIPRTSAALSQLFVEDPVGSPGASRHGSYLRTLNRTQTSKSRPFDGMALAPHVYGQGLLGGKFSDITVHAFGTSYSLHRLLLDRAPFFSTAFSGPWLEANSKEMKLDPADVDANITQAAFELALKRLYGCEDPEEEDQEAVGLFAVACWLEMNDLLDASIESLLRQMSPAKLSTYIRFVTGNYYGAAGSKVLTSARAMLCRDGWRMKLKYWDGIPADIIKDIVGSDGFFVTGEWERWMLAKRLLNRRLKLLLRDAGMVDEDGGAIPAPKRLSTRAIRHGRDQGRGPETHDKWSSLYLHPDIEQIQGLLDGSIHYVHMTFEQLQRIRSERDILGIPILPEKVISTALWMQMELRQKIVNADETELELGLIEQVGDVDVAGLEISSNSSNTERGSVDLSSEPHNDQLSDGLVGIMSMNNSISTKKAGKRRESPVKAEAEEESWFIYDAHPIDRTPKFWIPTVDATFPVGDTPQTSSSRSSGISRGSQDGGNRPEDIHWSGDLVALANAASESIANGSKMQRQVSETSSSPKIATVPSDPVAYTRYPPYRFSVEFPAAAMLRENKRFYSGTIWYAGSLWNVYVQKKDSNRGVQLGVYLHREKQSENTEIMLANYVAGHSVDERIGRLERELENRRRADRRVIRDGDMDASLGGPGAEFDSNNGILSRPARRPPKFDGLAMKGTSNLALPSASLSQPYDSESDSNGIDTESDSDEADPATSCSTASPAGLRARTPALPPYTDGRPTIKTYFKIYTPSRDGRILTVYESKPDKFNFSQSWGWKSGNFDGDGDPGLTNVKDMRDRRLRFMIVLGTV